MKILMYHDIVNEAPSDIHSVQTRNYSAQLAWLSDAGYRLRSLADCAASLAEGSESHKDIAVTFDDGYEDNLTNALPVLRQFGFTATVFLVTGFMGKTSTWRAGTLASARLLTWGQAREMLEGNIQLGSHTVTHARLGTLGAQELHNELALSRQQIEQETGVRTTTLSYPYSDISPRVEDVARRMGFKACCTYRPRYVGSSGYEVMRLERIGVLATDTLDTFARKLRGDIRLSLDWHLHRWNLRSRVSRFMRLACGSTGN